MHEKIDEISKTARMIREVLNLVTVKGQDDCARIVYCCNKCDEIAEKVTALLDNRPEEAIKVVTDD